MKYSQEKNYIICGSQDGSISLVNLSYLPQKLTPIKTIQIKVFIAHKDPVRDLAWLTDSDN